MKQQILIINGGSTFENEGQYLQYLKNRGISLEGMKRRDNWKSKIQTDLGEDYEVLFASMPNTSNAKYREWVITFEKIIPLLNEDVILIGHSLGGIFLAGYIGENGFPKKIKATILLAAPFDDETEESLGDFKFLFSLSKLKTQGGKIYILHSNDDPVVPVTEVKKYKDKLPNAKIMLFDDKQHFNQESFPELIELIKQLNADVA